MEVVETVDKRESPKLETASLSQLAGAVAFKRAAYQNYRSELGNGACGDVVNPYMAKFVEQHFPSDRRARILELGCGAGALLRVMERAGYRNLEGYDCSPFQVEHRLSNAVRFGDGLAALRDEADAAIDVVVAFDVIEHLTREELLAWALEVKRVLKPGGRWIVHVPNAAGLFGNRVRYADLTHEMAFTWESLRQLGSIAGFASTVAFEDRPVVHGIKSGLRRLIWELCRIPILLFCMAETGDWRKCMLSQNMVGVLYA